MNPNEDGNSSSHFRRHVVKYSPLQVEPADAEIIAAAQDGFHEEFVAASNHVDNGEDFPHPLPTMTGTQSRLSTAINLAKCICGAGSFALPHVFWEEGILGGLIAMTLCAGLAALTMQSLCHSKLTAMHSNHLARQRHDSDNSLPQDYSIIIPKQQTSLTTPILISSYVELARHVLGEKAATLVFTLTLSASMGVCSTYLVFIGQTLESLSCDTTSHNVIRQWLPNVRVTTWEMVTALLVVPLSCLRSYGMLAWTSALGVVAVMGGIVVTLAYGIWVDPGGGLHTALQHVYDNNIPWWPRSLTAAFGGSFGTIAYLFCINFLTFPIINSMKAPHRDYGPAVITAVAGVWVVNVIFAILCVGFYGEQTQDLVLGNLDNGPYLSALKLLLCVDLLFTFPIVFSGGRQILEHAIFGADSAHVETAEDPVLAAKRASLVTVAVGACLGLAQIGGFGAVANLVGGVAQGTLAFILPPLIAVKLSRRNNPNGDTKGEMGQLLVCAFGVVVVSCVSYFTVFQSS